MHNYNSTRVVAFTLNNPWPRKKRQKKKAFSDIKGHNNRRLLWTKTTDLVATIQIALYAWRRSVCIKPAKKFLVEEYFFLPVHKKYKQESGEKWVGM